MADPAITSIAPTGGSADGGAAVVITGTDLGTPTAVAFGSEAATSFAGASDTQVFAVAPAGTGTVHVTVTTGEGTSAESTADQFSYGAALFTIAEARAYPFRSTLPLADATLYSATAVAAAEESIRELFTRSCGVAFLPTTITETRDGVASQVLHVSQRNPVRETPRQSLTVSAASIDGTALTADELAAIKAHPDGRLVRSDGNTWSSSTDYEDLAVSVTYTHGWAAVPAPIHDAALRMAAVMLVGSDIPESAVSFSDDGATYQLARPGRAPHWTGIDYVDSRLAMFAENAAVIA
jgi:hypothetical protein